MTEFKQIYKCAVCGNVVEVLHPGAGELVCCGKPMELQVVHLVTDEGTEKHVPVRVGRMVKIGEVAHPMEENHFIEWVEKVSDTGKYARKHLKAGEAPEVPFGNRGEEILRCYCNVHGLWESGKSGN